MKKELYSIPKAVTAVYFDGTNLEEVQAIAPKATIEHVQVNDYSSITRVILNGDNGYTYDNTLYPGQWAVVRTYSYSRYHKASESDEVYYTILDNLDEYIETSKVIITE